MGYERHINNGVNERRNMVYERHNMVYARHNMVYERHNMVYENRMDGSGRMAIVAVIFDSTPCFNIHHHN